MCISDIPPPQSIYCFHFLHDSYEIRRTFHMNILPAWNCKNVIDLPVSSSKILPFCPSLTVLNQILAMVDPVQCNIIAPAACNFDYDFIMEFLLYISSASKWFSVPRPLLDTPKRISPRGRQSWKSECHPYLTSSPGQPVHHNLDIAYIYTIAAIRWT